MHLDQRRFGEGVNVNESAIRPEQTVNVLKGMNHARMSHSSQRPGEDHAVEKRWLAGSGEVFKRNGVKFDAIM